MRLVFLRPWVQSKVRFQNSVQIFFFGRQIRNYFVDLGNDGAKKRCCTKKQENAKHLGDTGLGVIEIDLVFVPGIFEMFYPLSI